MTWFLKIASPEEYLGTLGAPSETIQWIMSQPEYQFYINEFRKNPGVDITSLQPPQKHEHEHEPTKKELQRVNWFVNDSPIRQWSLVQLRKFRVRLNPLSNGDIDYDYFIPMTQFDNLLSQINDWYRNKQFDNQPVDIASYTWDQALVATEQWHQEQAAQGEGTEYDEFDENLTVFRLDEWDGWFMQKVMSENDLTVEGNRMNHCVGSYCRQVESGTTEIYSLRDPQNLPHVTVEIEPQYNEVIQVIGNSNSEPKDEYKELVTQWFAELQKEKPGLQMRGQEFDFEDLKYTDNSELDEKITEIVYSGGSENYGLKMPLTELDVEYPYEAVIKELTAHHMQGADTRYVSYIGPVLAQIAWDADKQRAMDLGLVAGFGIVTNNTLTPEESKLKFKQQSENTGVHWLWEKIQKNNEDFLEYFMDYDPYQKREEFESDEAYQTAIDEERDDAELKVRSESMPAALDDQIATALADLARTDPYLPEHDAYKLPEEESKVASTTWRHVYASPEGWLRQQGVPDDILQYALDDNRFPRKMQKWVALQLHKLSSSWLTKLASVELMYHGTSDALTQKILSEGLAPNRDLVWDSERAESDQRSRESYGGIYFTNNFMTAWGAARTATEQFGGGRLMTISQLELRSDSLLQDEDQQNNPLGSFNKVLGVNANDYFYMQWAANDFYNLDQITDKYLDEISLDPRSGEPKPGFEDPRQREALVPYVTDFIKASVMREIAIAVEQERGSQFPTLKYKYPQFQEMQVSEAEADYRQASSALMEKTRFMTNNVKRFMHNVRSMEPVSFKGRNKVVLVAKIHEDTYDSDTRTRSYIDGKYNDDAEILYSTSSEAIQMLARDMTERLGGGIRIRDAKTVYLDHPRES